MLLYSANFEGSLFAMSVISWWQNMTEFLTVVRNQLVEQKDRVYPLVCSNVLYCCGYTFVCITAQ